MFEYDLTPAMVEAVAEFTGLHPEEIRVKDVEEAVDTANDNDNNWCPTAAGTHLLAVARAQRRAAGA